MTQQRTEQQSDSQMRLASQLSLAQSQPPGDVPGYEPQQFLGSGAYGEVWVAVDKNTGRQVAIKFYTHRGGLDWQLLSHEVEKLVLLSADRYIVQVLEVGWDASPPYYVMEYVENGSLAEYLDQTGPLPVHSAVEMFRGIATGLMHAHGKGVLHCDVKPANVLLDQDHHPRLADFGQSRLSNEQTPALGTLFYMAPEQADLEAVPDARWDVYAMGAILYTMLTGKLPYRDPATVNRIDRATSLPKRLENYRKAIRDAPRPSDHQKTPGIDRALVEIIDRCLAVKPKHRFPNVQSVLEALESRDRARARRPLLVLGLLGPALLLTVMAIFGWIGYDRAMSESDTMVTQRAQDSNRFAAQFVSSSVAHELERYHRAVEILVENERFLDLFEETINHPELAPMLAELEQLSGSKDLPKSLADNPEKLAQLRNLRDQFEAHDTQATMHAYMKALHQDDRKPKVASWILTDANGTHVATAFPELDPEPNSKDPASSSDAKNYTFSSPNGKNYAYRTYFHGGPEDLDPAWRRPPDEHLDKTRLSAVFLSTASNTWKVAVSTPIMRDGKFLGVLGVTVEMGGFLREFENNPNRYAVLVDGRPGPFRGVILQHPLYEQLLKAQPKLPQRFNDYRVNLGGVVQGASDSDIELTTNYEDPLGGDEAGGQYAGDWIMAKAPVRMRRGPADDDGEPTANDTGWVVLVQENHDAAIQPVHRLGSRLVRDALMALAVVVLLITLLWYIVIRALGNQRGTQRLAPYARDRGTATGSQTTVPAGQ